MTGRGSRWRRRGASAMVCVALVGSVLAGTAAPAGASYDNGWIARTFPFGTTPSGGSSLDAVGCASAAYCVAVGAFRASTATVFQSVMDIYRDGSWEVYDTPAPKGASTVTLNAVACTAGGGCTVGGNYSTASGVFALAEALENTSVLVTTIPNPPGAGTVAEHRQDVSVESLACPTTGTCVAAGAYEDPTGDRHPLLARLSGGSWTSLSAPVPANFVPNVTYGDLADVQCLSPTACIAGGWYDGTTTGGTPNPRLHGLVDVWAGSSWSTEGTAAYDSVLHAACASATRCFAPAGSTMYEDDAGTWSSVTVPVPAGAPAGTPHLTQIACPAQDTCVAMGSWLPTLAGTGWPLVATWNGTSWSDVIATGPTNALSSPAGPWAQVYGLSCGSTTSCVGVGWYRDDTGVGFFNPLVVRWTRGTVTTTEGPEPPEVPAETPNGGGIATAPYGRLLEVACASAAACVATGAWWAGTSAYHGFLDTFAAPAPSGYDMVGSDGGVFVFNALGHTGGFYGSLPGLGVHVNDIVGMTPTSGDGGYYLVGSDGGVFAFGNAPYLGSLPGIDVTPTQPIVGIVPTGTGGGYFLVGRDGGVFTFGNAPFLGSLPGIGVGIDDVVGIAATPSGDGYWVIAATGAVYAFGAAGRFGSATGSASPVTSIAGTPDGTGYWVATRDGGVQAFGDVTSFGSLPTLGVTPALPVVDIVRTSNTGGYWLVGADGGLFAFGDAGYSGSLPGLGVHVDDIVGAVPTS